MENVPFTCPSCRYNFSRQSLNYIRAPEDKFRCPSCLVELAPVRKVWVKIGCSWLLFAPLLLLWQAPHLLIPALGLTSLIWFILQVDWPWTIASFDLKNDRPWQFSLGELILSILILGALMTSFLNKLYWPLILFLLALNIWLTRKIWKTSKQVLSPPLPLGEGGHER